VVRVRRSLPVTVALLLVVTVILVHHGRPPHRASSQVRAAALSHPVAPVTRLRAAGTALLLDGRPAHLTGINDYGAATSYDVNWGCGSPTGDLDGLFAALRPGSLVRFWAFQAQGWDNKVTPQRQELAGIDRVVQAAERHHQLLIMTLSDQAGTCDDGHWHDQAFYDGGYQARYRDDGRGLGDIAYQQWVREVVERYRSSPAVGMWEPVNEPEASICVGGCDQAHRQCPVGAAQSLRHFFDDIGGQVHALDPGSLVALGTEGGGQCGLAGDDFSVVGSSPGVDVLDYHDYGAQTDALPSGLTDRLAQGRALGKPLLVEEAGIDAGQGCRSYDDRAALLRAKVVAAFAAGAAGYLPWWYSEAPGTGCEQDLGPHDPALAVLCAAPR